MRDKHRRDVTFGARRSVRKRGKGKWSNQEASEATVVQAAFVCVSSWFRTFWFPECPSLSGCSNGKWEEEEGDKRKHARGASARERRRRNNMAIRLAYLRIHLAKWARESRRDIVMWG